MDRDYCNNKAMAHHFFHYLLLLRLTNNNFCAFKRTCEHFVTNRARQLKHIINIKCAIDGEKNTGTFSRHI